MLISIWPWQSPPAIGQKSHDFSSSDGPWTASVSSYPPPSQPLTTLCKAMVMPELTQHPALIT